MTGPNGPLLLFHTARLDVRQLAPGDVDAMVAVYGDAESMRWVDDGRPLDRTACLRWIDVTRANVEQRGYGMSALVSRASGETIGFCGLVHPGGQTDAEIKYALRREHWGRGFATEAVAGMIAHGAGSLGLVRIIATLSPENAASRRVLEKCGMKREATRTSADGTRTDVFAWNGTVERLGDSN